MKQHQINHLLLLAKQQSHKLFFACLLACSKSTNVHADFFNDEFFQEFHELEANMQKMHDEMRKKTQNLFHNTFRQYVSSTATSGDNQSTQQGQSYAYQHSSNAVRYANNEKSIQLKEEKTPAATIYTIYVKDHQAKAQQHVQDPKKALENLQVYMQEHFKAPNAVNMLSECINALKHQDHHQKIMLETSTSEYEQKYKIQISQIQEPIDAKQDSEKVVETNNAEQQVEKKQIQPALKEVEQKKRKHQKKSNES